MRNTHANFAGETHEKSLTKNVCVCECVRFGISKE